MFFQWGFTHYGIGKAMTKKKNAVKKLVFFFFKFENLKINYNIHFSFSWAI